VVAAALGAVPRSSVRLLDAHAALQAAGSSLRLRRGLASWQVADPQFGAAKKLRWVRQPPHAAIIGSQWVQTPRHGDPIAPSPPTRAPPSQRRSGYGVRSGVGGQALRCRVSAPFAAVCRRLCSTAPSAMRVPRGCRCAGASPVFCGRFDWDLPVCCVFLS
jgi:hypothetical protein